MNVTINCLGCRRAFETREVELLGRTYVEDRYCGVCREAELVAVDQRRADLAWQRTLVPRDYRDCAFSNFEVRDGTAHAYNIAKTWCKDYRSGDRPRRGLMFFGPPGGGKTHLATAVLRETVYSSRAARCLFLNTPEWLNALRDSWGGGDRQEPPSPEGYEIVLLDDLGAENWSEWARDRIYTLVNHREQQGLLTLVTTNLVPGDLRRRVGGPTASRLTRLCQDVPVEPRRDYREILAERESTKAVGL